jgi:hypothetical protein
MIQLIYASKSEVPQGRALSELRSILAASQARNSQQKVTGYLVADGRSFFQVLEGEPVDVRRTFERIRSDPRHSSVQMLNTKVISIREFAAWSMGGWLCTPETLDIFIRHGFDECCPKSNITGSMIIGLAKELRDFEETTAQRLRRAG